jgi:hypothetical protein
MDAQFVQYVAHDEQYEAEPAALYPFVLRELLSSMVDCVAREGHGTVRKSRSRRVLG